MLPRKLLNLASLRLILVSLMSPLCNISHVHVHVHVYREEKVREFRGKVKAKLSLTVSSVL